MDLIPWITDEYINSLQNSVGLTYGTARISNFIFLFFCHAVIVDLVAEKVLIFSHRSKPPILSRLLFMVYSILHTIYYIVETKYTQIGEIRPCVMHHISSVAMFVGFNLMPNLLCFLTVLPFLLHSLMWVANDAEIFGMVALYNVVCLSAFVVTVATIAVEKETPKETVFQKMSKIMLIISLLCLIHSNIWFYCDVYSRSKCGFINSNLLDIIRDGFKELALSLVISSICTSVSFSGILTTIMGSSDYVRLYAAKSSRIIRGKVSA